MSPREIESESEIEVPEPDEALPAPDHKSHYIAGIGASAGGLEALTLLIGALPSGLNCSFAIVQHLSPHYRSMMVELIGRETGMQVKAVEDGEVPLPGVIYIAPPKWNLLLRNGAFALVEPRPDLGPKPSVNLFLKSLADEKGEYAIGVILSGTGSDGAVGIRAIKANGGITFAQAPDTAKYAGMPQAAINTVAVDYVLPPAGIAHEIAQLVAACPARPPGRPGRDRHPALRPAAPGGAPLHQDRLQRLQRVHPVAAGAPAHGDQPRGQPWRTIWTWPWRARRSWSILAKDILISVTSFFRDAEAFARLQRLPQGHPGGEIPGLGDAGLGAGLRHRRGGLLHRHHPRGAPGRGAATPERPDLRHRHRPGRAQPGPTRHLPGGRPGRAS